MKLAAGDIAVWLIIAIIVGAAKLWNKFVTLQGDEDEPAPAPPRPAPPRARPPSPPRPVTPQARKAEPEDFRDFMERLTRPAQTKPVPPPPPPVMRPATPPVAAPAVPVPPAPMPAPQPSRRPSQWAEALRDRQNLRNIIISAEIIGPPRGA